MPEIRLQPATALDRESVRASEARSSEGTRDDEATVPERSAKRGAGLGRRKHEEHDPNRGRHAADHEEIGRAHV